MFSQGVSVRDLESVTALRTRLDADIASVNDLVAIMRRDVLEAEEYFQGANYNRLLDYWQKALQSLQPFLAEAPSYVQYLREIELAIAALISIRPR